MGYFLVLALFFGLAEAKPPKPPKPTKEQALAKQLGVPDAACPFDGGLMGWTEVEWRDRAALEADEASRASVAMRAPEPVPVDAVITMRVLRPSIDLANPGLQLVVLVDANGVEVQRTEGAMKVPDVPASGKDLWRGFDVVMVNTAPALPAKLFVIDRAAQLRCEWAIGTDGARTYVGQVRAQ